MALEDDRTWLKDMLDLKGNGPELDRLAVVLSDMRCEILSLRATLDRISAALTPTPAA